MPPSFNNLNDFNGRSNKPLPLNIVFMGTPEIASESLSGVLNLIKLNIVDLKCVYTKPPVWNSKKKEIIESPVNIVAAHAGINVRTPKGLKHNPDEVEFLKSLNLDLLIVAAFGVILPDEILSIPKYGVLNLHPSLLPDLRGPSPVHYAILKRMKYSGISVMALDSGVDSGPILAQNRVAIGKDEYFESFYENLSKSGTDLLSEVVKTVFAVRLHLFEYAYSQSLSNTKDITESKLIDLKIQKIDFFSDEPLDIYSKIRAFRELGGAYFIYNGKAVKLNEAKLIINTEEAEGNGIINSNNIPCRLNVDGDETFNEYYDYKDYSNNESNGSEALNFIENLAEFRSASGGTVVMAGKSGLVVKLSRKGIYLSITMLKPEGKKLMGFLDFINGHRLKAGDILR